MLSLFRNKMIVLFFLSIIVIIQYHYVAVRYGELSLLKECSWCDENSTIDDTPIYIPLNSDYLRFVAPADPDFISDILWLQICYYFGQQALSNGKYMHLFSLLDMTTDLSPKWKRPYMFAALMLPFEANDIPGGFYMIEKGLMSLPDTWQLWFFKGYHLWKYQNNLEEASMALVKAASISGSPEFLSSLAMSLSMEVGQDDFLRKYVLEMLNTISDPAQKNILFEKFKIEKLRFD